MAQSSGIPASYGAVDLSRLSSTANQSSSDKVEYRVVVDVTAADWQQISEWSAKVPVILEFLSKEDDASSQLEPLLREAVESQKGKILLGRVDVASAPEIVQAFQISETPAVFALVKGRPLPLFNGVVPRSDIDQVIVALLHACAQAGVVGTLNPVPVEDAEGEVEPPKEYQQALAAREQGKVDEEVKAWKKVLAQNPADKVAEQNLAESQMRARLVHLDGNNLSDLDRAEVLFAHGEIADSLDLLLSIVAGGGEDKEAARERLLEKFTVLGNQNEQVKTARARLANLLF